MKLARHLTLLLATAALAGAQTNVEEITDRIATAALRGEVAAVRTLVEQDGGARGAGGTTALLNSARVGQLAIIKAMCEAGADPNRLGRKGSLPLLLAIGGRQPAAVRLLLEHGADPNKVGLCSEPKCTKHPALPLAVYLGETETVKALLAARADVAWQEHQATQAANMNGDVAVFDLLKRAGGHAWTEHPSVRLKLPGAAEAARARKETAPVAPSVLGFTEIIPASAATSAPRPDGEKCRMAILADEANRAAVDLLAAKFTGSGSLELVERSEIEKILTEQKLARDFSADSANAARLGSLLRADALLLVRTTNLGETPLVETRLVRVNPGLILDTSFRPAPLANIGEWAAQTAARIAPLAGKSIARNGVAFSMVNLRATLGSLENRLLEQRTSALLTDRLVHQPQFHVLERNALDQLAREIGTAGKASFWTGSYLLDGSIDAAGGTSDALKLTIRLQSVGTEKVRTFAKQGRALQLPALLDAAVAELASSLGKTAVKVPDDLPAEAAAYAREAGWAKASGIPLAASAAAETAWALGDHSADVARLRVEMASQAIQSEVIRIGYPAHHAIGWQGASIWAVRDLLNHPLRPADALSEELFVSLATRAVAAWRDVLAARPEGLAREEWLKTGLDVFNKTLMAVLVVDTAAAKIRMAEPLRNLKTELSVAVKEARETAKDTPRFADFCIFEAGNAHTFIESPSELAERLEALLGLHFPVDDLLTRARIRAVVVGGASGGDYIQSLSVTDHHGGSGGGGGFTLMLPKPFPNRTIDMLAAKLTAAPAPEDQLTGVNLRIRGYVPGFRFPADFDKAVELAWGLRHHIAKDTRMLGRYLGMLIPNPLYATDETRSRTVPGSDRPRPANLPPQLMKLRRDYFIALCAESGVLDDTVAQLLDPDLYDDAQKRAVHDAIEAHLARVDGTENIPANYAAEWRKPAGPNRKAAPVAARAPVSRAPAIRPDVPVPPNTQPLRIDKVWSEPEPAKFGTVATPCLNQMMWAEDAIWFFMETTDSFEPTAPGSASVVRVDLPSLVAKPIQMPEQPGTPSVLKNGARVLVFPTQLIVTYPGRYLAVCDRASGKWQYFTAIKPDRDVVLIDGQLFLTVKDDQSLGVMRFDVTTKATELLVSTRRNPPESPLDVATLQIIGAFANEAGEFVLSIQTREGGETKRAFWAWAPATRTWRESRDEKQAADFFKRMNGFIRGGVLRVPSGNETDENARAVMAAAPGRSERPGLPLLVDFTHPPGVPFGKREGRDGGGKDMVRRPSQWRQCGQGYVFDSGGYRFWFLSNEQFDGFTKASSPVP